ncbi:hypothetical protein KQX54_004706 [Cotesia glomerata]|uniref:Uncharacterized protein n=1 Tax=Cotesia glomerata TaxID=32391 RepID=A0AAV7IT89_COTGL|nr:hypothetical protein KQX54_004706 [Cotesia glomerata]
MNFGNHLHEIGLLDLNGKVRFNLYEEKIRSLIKNNQLTTAVEVLDELLFNSPSISNLTGIKRYFFSYLDNQNPDNWDTLVEWIQRPDIRAAIHVSYDTPFKIVNETIFQYLQHEFMNSEADKWEGGEEFKNASRSVWWSSDELVGYFTKVRNLSVVLIRNAGHASGIEQPKWVLEMITQFTHN